MARLQLRIISKLNEYKARSVRLHVLSILAVVSGLVLPVNAQASEKHIQASEFVEPEFSSNSPVNDALAGEKSQEQTVLEDAIRRGKLAKSNKQMLVSAHPLATRAGVDVLNRGGNAVDAMVAVQTVLGLVEPQSSGLGGGAFTLFYKADDQNFIAYDGRETAPLDASKGLFLKPDQSPMGFFDAVVGGRSVGTPGTVALLWHMHQQHGALAWESLLRPAIELAQDGFTVSPRMAASIARDQKRLATHPISSAYFLPNGTPLNAGETRTNKAYAESLTLLAKHGGNYFYSEDFASGIVDAVRSSNNPGRLSIKDFAEYHVVERAPTCSEFLAFDICGMGPPSSGALSVGQILAISQHAGLSSLAPNSPKAWHVVSEATRSAFADRGLYIADPEYFDVPTWLLEPQYLAQRAKQIHPSHKRDAIEAGSFKQDKQTLVSGVENTQPSTSHFSIIDQHGNIISSTTTIENAFGSRLMVNGFLLNNELTDFSFRYENELGQIANRVEPGKRPRSSMAPTIVFKDDRPVLVVGSPGGSRIINYLANTLLRFLAWDEPVYAALNAPHISNRYGDMDIEAGRWPASFIVAFEGMGYTVKERDLNSGLHAIQIDDQAYIGAADERREGTAGY